MEQFCAAIRIHSISLLRFSFLSNVQVFSCEISLVCRLIYPYSCFSSYFYFLVILVMLMLELSLWFVSLLLVVVSLLKPDNCLNI